MEGQITWLRVGVPSGDEHPLRIRDLVGESLSHDGWDSFSVAVARPPESHEPTTPSGDWRESDAVKLARRWLAQIDDPLWPGYTESDWAGLLRKVLEERDFIGEWLQRMLDDEYERNLRENAST